MAVTISVDVAARILNKSHQFIRIGLQRELLPFGVGYKTRPSNKNYNYIIYKHKFEEYTGVNVDEWIKENMENQ